MNITESPIVASLKGGAEKPAGSIDLAGYRCLTYAPFQWGDGVRIASTGLKVADVALAAAKVNLVGTIETLAHGLDLTWDELFDALRYARDHGPL